MKGRKILSIALTAILLLTLMVVQAFAAGGDDAHEDHSGWTEFTAELSGRDLTEGNYYLSDDVALTNPVSVANTEVTVCLNGHTITGSPLKVRNNGVLTICDCVDNGAISVKNAVQMNGGTLYLQGGMLNGGSGSGILESASGNQIYISGGSVNSTSSTEAAVKMKGGTLHVSGGSIGGGAKYAISMENESALYLSGEPEITGTDTSKFSLGAEIFLDGTSSKKAVTNLVYAADEEMAYSGKELKISLSSMNQGLEDGVSFVKEVSQENYNKFTLQGIETGKALNYDEANGQLVYGDYEEYIPGHKHNEDGTAGTQTWIAWDGTTDLTENGYYYLEKDVTVAGIVEVTAKDAHLCLNGHTLSGKGSAVLRASGGLTLCDCKGSGEVVNTGVSSDYDVVVVKNSFTLYSGTLRNQKGEGVYIYHENGSATFNMEGGNIIAATRGIYDRKGNVVMTDGSVTYGGKQGMYMSGGSAKISGGTFQPSSTPNEEADGIWVSAGDLTISGDAQITGVQTGVDYSIFGTSSHSFHVNGGQITASAANGYGISTSGDRPLYLSGTPTISGSGGDLYINTYSCPTYASDNGVYYTGSPLTVHYNGADTTNPIIRDANDASKFQLIYPKDKALVLQGNNLVLGTPSQAAAYEFKVQFDQETYSVGDTASVSIYLSSNAANANFIALNFELAIPEDLMLQSVTTPLDGTVSQKDGKFAYNTSGAPISVTNEGIQVATAVFTVNDFTGDSKTVTLGLNAMEVTESDQMKSAECSVITDSAVLTRTVTLTFQAGEHVTMSKQQISVPVGTLFGSVNKPSFTLDDYYDFMGWYKEDGTKMGENDPISSSLTLIAQASAKQFDFAKTEENTSITVTSGVVNEKATYNTDITFTAKPVSVGYLLSEVTYQINGGEAISLSPNDDGSYTIPGSEITGNITIKAAASSVVWNFITEDQYAAAPAGKQVAILNVSALADETYTLTNYGNMFWSSEYDGYVCFVDNSETSETLTPKLTVSQVPTVSISYSGDINGDGSVTSSDSAPITAALHEFDVTYEITDLMRFQFDVTGDKMVTTSDIQWILDEFTGAGHNS